MRDSLGNPNTVRNYGIGIGETADRIGEGRAGGVETAARGEEILGVNMKEPDSPDAGPGQGDGRPPAHPSPRRGPRELRAGARPLGRRHRPAAAPPAQGPYAGPAFVTHRRPSS
ncbi:hypothetical protein [Streptomyces sp. KR55]|uniref:hypothetical protein n=1 Tax=Streptomyces sp. KR55 TaxID=3457425 RepID=UPI003FD61269